MTIKQISEAYDIPIDTLRYYEKVGMIPPVERTAGGIRNYGESDIGWIRLAKCMRSAGLPVEAMIEYRKLYEQGDSTIEARYRLLANQREVLLEQKSAIEDMITRLNYKIERYEAALKTGVLSWDSPADNPECAKEVREAADRCLSTGGMCAFVKESPATSFVIGTEAGILHRLRKENPEKTFTAIGDLECADMKKITLEKLRDSLRDLKHEVTVPDGIAERARKAIEAMLRIV